MAKKRKNSTALFEVISAGRMDRKPVAAALKTPRWWFKGQSGPAAAAAEASSPVTIQTDPADPTANVTAAMLYRARQQMTPPAPVAPVTTAPAAAPSAPAAPAPIAVGPAADDAYATADLQDIGLASAPQAGALPPPSVAPAISAAPPAAGAAAARAIVPASAAAAAAPLGASAARPGSPRAVGASKFRFDEDSQEVTLKMRYTTAIVTAFSVLVVVGTAYVIGRHLAEGPSPATAAERQQTTAQVKRGPSQPGVMDLSQRSGSGPMPRLDTGNKPRPESPPRNPTGPTAPAADGPASPAPAATVYADARIAPDGTAQRIGNLNYLMILNLPSQYRERIYEVRDLMTANGVPCTVEKVSKVRGSPKIPAPDGWYAVVGVRGFSPKYGQLPEYRAYKNAIAAAAARFPSKAKFEKIEPLDFKWIE